MLKCNSLLKVCLSLLFSISALSINAAEKIKDLEAHLSKDTKYSKAPTLSKFSILSKLCQDKLINSYDEGTKKIVNDLTKTYMTEKGKNDPIARLKAYSELYDMNAKDKPLYKLKLDENVCSLDFISYLSNSKDYQSGNVKKKKEILEKLIKDRTWVYEYGQSQATIVGINYIEEMTAGLKPMEKAIKSLELLSQMKESGLIRWGGSYSGLEKVYLYTYLNSNPAYKKMSIKNKAKHLRDLESKGVIMSFIQSDIESSLIAEQLARDPNFIKLSLEKKQEKINEMEKNREIHTFSGGKIHRLLGIPEKQ